MINPHGTRWPQARIGHYPGESQYGRLYTDNNWQQVEYTFSGEIATIFITTTPRLLVVRRGPCIKERETGVTLGRLLDHYDIL